MDFAALCLTDFIDWRYVHTVHKVNPKLLPMECIPETQFLIRSKIYLGMLI
jgi:hypothetical protein